MKIQNFTIGLGFAVLAVGLAGCPSKDDDNGTPTPPPSNATVITPPPATTTQSTGGTVVVADKPDPAIKTETHESTAVITQTTSGGATTASQGATTGPSTPKNSRKPGTSAAALPGAPTAARSHSLPGGMQYKDMKVGTGQTAKAGDHVVMQYTGYLVDGTTFDSSLKTGQPFEFDLGAGRVIKGWDEGVAGMKVGGKRKLIIPPDLGYGASGTPGGPIPPNARLIFDVELVSIGNRSAGAAPAGGTDVPADGGAAPQ